MDSVSPPYRFPTEALQRAPCPAAVPDYANLPTSLQTALHLGWQWLHGEQQFTVPTSGSTGTPQRIKISRQQMLVSIRLTQQALKLRPQHTALLCLNPGYIGGVMMIARALHIGMDLLWVPATAHPLKATLRQVDFVAMVPLQLQAVLDDDPTLLHGAHAILIGGAPISAALEKRVRTQVLSPVYSTYGMTETLSHIALRRLNGPEVHPYFRVLGDTKIGVDARGCLTIQGEITRHRSIATNDLVELVDQQHFRWRGRYDWVINSGGVKVSPEPIENVVEEQWAVVTNEGHQRHTPRFFVAGVPDERLGERVVLVVEATPDSEERQRQLLKAVAAYVPRYHAPKEVWYIPHFVETGNGKLDRPATIARGINA